MVDPLIDMHVSTYEYPKINEEEINEIGDHDSDSSNYLGVNQSNERSYKLINNQVL